MEWMDKSGEATHAIAIMGLLRSSAQSSNSSEDFAGILVAWPP
jgi:hypothetical protein